VDPSDNGSLDDSAEEKTKLDRVMTWKTMAKGSVTRQLA
jgi:hypothetical protein